MSKEALFGNLFDPQQSYGELQGDTWQLLFQDNIDTSNGRRPMSSKANPYGLEDRQVLGDDIHSSENDADGKNTED